MGGPLPSGQHDIQQCRNVVYGWHGLFFCWAYSLREPSLWENGGADTEKSILTDPLSVQILQAPTSFHTIRAQNMNGNESADIRRSAERRPDAGMADSFADFGQLQFERADRHRAQIGRSLLFTLWNDGGAAYSHESTRTAVDLPKNNGRKWFELCRAEPSTSMPKWQN